MKRCRTPRNPQGDVQLVELRAVSSYLIAVVAIMKRCRDRLLRLSSIAVVSVKAMACVMGGGRELCVPYDSKKSSRRCTAGLSFVQ